MVTTELTSNRRSLLAGVAMALAASKTAGAVTPVEVGGDADPQYLLTGMSTGGFSATILGVEVFTASLSRIGSVEVPDGVVNYAPTGRAGISLLTTLFGSAIVDLENTSRADISWETADPGYVVPATPDEGLSYNPKYLLAQGFDASSVLLIDLETLEGRDISESISNESTSMLALVPDIPEEGSQGGIWTGDNVFLIDFADPASAEKLVGDDPDWYSTTLNLSHNGEWAIFTTYDPAEGGQIANVYLQNVESGEYEQILEGHAWTTGFFIPNDADHFMALSAEGLEKRALNAPSEAGELVAEVGQMGVKARWMDDGAKLLYGHREMQDGLYSWILIDMETLGVQELPGLEGLKPQWPRLARTRPEHLLFVEDEYNLDAYTMTGLNLDSGEVWSIIDEPVKLPILNGITASEDGRWYTVSSINSGQNIGNWLINMETQELHEFVQGEDDLYSEYAAVSPDGETVAVTMLQQPDGVQSTWTAPTSDPANLTELTDSIVIGWV